MLEDTTKPNQRRYVHGVPPLPGRQVWPEATIKLTATFLLDSGNGDQSAIEAFARHGLPRAAGPVTEENPLVLPKATDGADPHAPCWLAIYETYEDLKYGYE